MATLTTYKTAPSTECAAIMRIMKGLNELGWATYSYNDTEETQKLHNASPERVACIVGETDMAHIYICKPAGKSIIKDMQRATLLFILGNEPWEVLADCSMSDVFTPDLEAVEEAANLEGCNA